MLEENDDQWVLISSFLQMPSEIKVARNATFIIKLEGSHFEKVSTQLANTSILLKHLLRDQNRWCVLERYFQDYWIQWILDKQPNATLVGHNKPNYKEQNLTEYKCKTLTDWCNQNICDILPYIREEKIQTPDGELYEELPLDMDPPDHICTQNFSRLSSSCGNYKPDTYLHDKYLETLFAFNIPIIQFVKSKLTRVALLCKQYKVTYSEILRNFILDISTFDKRHDSKNMGILYFDDLPTNAKEFRSVAVKEFSNINLENPEKHKDIASDVSNLLKLKDIKLQVILILELIKENKWDHLVKEFESNYDNEIEKKSAKVGYVVSRLKRRKPNKESHPIPSQRNALSYFKQLDILLDKVRIVEALFSMELSMHSETASLKNPIHESKISVLNANKEDSIAGFVKYILVPFWQKKLPNTVAFFINKIRGPDLTSRTNHTIQNDKKSMNVKANSSFSEGDKNLVSGSDQFSRPLHSSHVPSLLRTRTTSNLTEFLEDDSNKKRPTVASRTASDLKLNHLEKRQMSVQDLSLDDAIRRRQKFSEDLRTSNSIVVNGKSVTFAQGFSRSFQRNSSHKSTISTEMLSSARKEDQVHVMATPAKSTERTKLQPILVESPAFISATSIKSPSSNLADQTIDKPKRVKRRLFAP